MHPSRRYLVTDPDILRQRILEHPFAVISAVSDGQPVAAHAPILPYGKRLPSGEGEALSLRFHLSVANPVTKALLAGSPVLAVFTGPHAYVSPDWYGLEDQVPTWNYISVEAAGPVTRLGDAAMRQLIDDLRCIGYGGLVHINWIDRNAEISFLMDTSLETHFFKRNWLSFLALIQELAFEELNLHKVYTYAFDLRPHLYDVLESAGFKREAVLPEHCLFESRYIDVVIHSKFNRQIFLRPVEKSDFEITYAWAVNPIIRAYALNQSPITRESHKSWFLKKEKDKSCLFYIAEYNSKPAGAFRLDLNKDGSALISYLLDSQYHNLGLGTALLRAGIEKAKCQPEISALIGQVLKDNKASVRIFEKLDFFDILSL